MALRGRWNWKPTDSAADDLSVMEDTSSVSKTVVPDEPAPVRSGLIKK